MCGYISCIRQRRRHRASNPNQFPPFRFRPRGPHALASPSPAPRASGRQAGRPAARPSAGRGPRYTERALVAAFVAVGALVALVAERAVLGRQPVGLAA
jgi:hypothetical protein